MLADILALNKSALCRIASLVFIICFNVQPSLNARLLVDSLPKTRNITLFLYNAPINVKSAVGGGRAYGGDLTFLKNLPSNSSQL